MNEKPAMSNLPSSNTISSRSLRNRTIVVSVFIALIVVIIPLLSVTLFSDFDRWTAQWQVWWGLRQAKETAVTQATVIAYYQENEDNFILYRYSTPNGQQFEKTEQVKNSIYQQAENGESLLVDFAVDKPNIAGITGNIDPFSGPIAILLMVGLILVGKAGKRRRYTPVPSLLKKVSKLDKTTGTQSIQQPRKISQSWPGIEVILIALLLLIIQFGLIYLFLTK